MHGPPLHGVWPSSHTVWCNDVPWTRQRGAVVPKLDGRTQWVVVSAAVATASCGGSTRGTESDVQPLFNVL